MEELNNYGFGAIPSSYDLRDYKLSKTISSIDIVLPETYQLDIKHVKDQGSTGTCTVQSLATLIEYHYQNDTGVYKKMSTTFLYGFRDQVSDDKDYIGEGMKIRDALKVASNYGDVAHNIMPGNHDYDESKKLVLSAGSEVLSQAYENRISSYYKIKDENELKYSILNDGPVIAGMYWFDNYKLVKNIYTYKKDDTYKPHAVVIIGWDKENWIVQNSWGRYWGDNGRFYIPIEKSFKDVFFEAYGVTDNIENVYVPPDNLFIDILNVVIRFIKQIVGST